jgi:hypothetical protein
MDGSLHLGCQLWRDYIHPVRFLSVFRALLENLLFRFAACHEVAVNAGVPATNYF